MRWFAAILCAAVIALHAVPSVAQAVCGDRGKLMTHLDKTYAERPVAMGLTSTGAVFELFTSTTGSWTILVTYPTGPTTCMVATGENWEALPIVAAGTIS